MTVELRGAHVLLRPFRREEFDAVYEARERLGLVHGQGSGARSRLRRRLERSGRFERGCLDLAIEVGGRLVGEIDARQPAQALPPGVFELGIALFDEADRGRGYGSEALELLTTYLFDEAGAERVQASTSVENRAMRRALEKLGFREEGVLRAFMPERRGRADYVLAAVTRGDRDTLRR